MALAGPALAQDQPKSLKTIKIHEPAPGVGTLYVIDEDGTVRIDWPAVETLAASKADRTVLPLAQLMLAIRGGRGNRRGEGSERWATFTQLERLFFFGRISSFVSQFSTPPPLYLVSRKLSLSSDMPPKLRPKLKYLSKS